jgi:spermidine/putrescine transport system ATP-binding protein
VIAARTVDGGATSGAVTLAVRPEHASLKASGGTINGTLQNIVYFGTDTHYHVDLEDGSNFVVRRQNQPDAGEDFAVGQAVGVHFKDGIGQVLRD